MLGLLWLIPGLPLAAFVVLALAGSRLPRSGVAVIGVGSVAASAALAVSVALGFVTAPPAGHAFSQTLWTWMSVGRFAPSVALYLDPLSLAMVVVVTVVGFLIHLYSAAFMADDPGYARFFAYLNLFVASMLVLVLADNLLLLYLGWEGVGLCSYLLIGFWYRERANAAAGMKAFIVTRVGDAALAVGLLLLFTHLGTLELQPLMRRALVAWPIGSPLALAAAALLLAGAVGKSAQLPLQTWLPDAMAGPTPVSALLHAATMVTAGVYLIARTHVLFALAPPVQWLVAVIGAATLLLGGFSALAQWDLKRALAYSTMSQIGYMFLALGVGAWSAAMLHFVTHACSKSLLFLAAGAVIKALGDEHDMSRMGGLRRKLPLVFWTFLVGAASLASLPIVTAGFYSKDLLLYQTFVSIQGGPWLWAAGLLGAAITGLYAFRLVFLTFLGPEREEPRSRPGPLMQIPLLILAVLALTVGLAELPRTLGDWPWFSRFLAPVLPPVTMSDGSLRTEGRLQLLSEAASIAGLLAAYVLFLRRPASLAALARHPPVAALRRLWLSGWGFDWAYDRLFVRPFVRLARRNREDCIDALYLGLAASVERLHRLLSRTQMGKVRWYVAGVALGAAVLLALVVLR